MTTDPKPTKAAAKAKAAAKRKGAAQRKAAERERLRAMGLRPLEVWAPPEHHAQIKALALKLSGRVPQETDPQD